VGIDGALRTFRHPADFGDLAGSNPDIGLESRRACAIDHDAVPDHEIVAHRFLPGNTDPYRKPYQQDRRFSALSVTARSVCFIGEAPLSRSASPASALGAGLDRPLADPLA